MIEFIFTMLKNWRYVLVFTLLVGGSILTALLEHKVTKYTELNVTLTHQVTTLQTTNTDMHTAYEERITNLSDAITLQNKNIAMYQAQVVDLQNTIATQTEEATEARAEYDKRALSIMNDAKLADAASCTTSMGYLLDSVQDLKWKTK